MEAFGRRQLRDRAAARIAGRRPPDRSRCGLDRVGVGAGRERARRAVVESTACPGSAAGRQNRITPTLSDSPRSMRGTTLRIAYWNGLGSAARPLDDPASTVLRLGDPVARCGHANAARYSTCGGRSADRLGQPRVGDRRDDRLERRRQDGAGERRSASAIEPAPGSSTWSRICGNGGRGRARQRRARRAGRTERGAVVDQPERRCHTRRFGLRGVRSTLVTSASNQTTSAAKSPSGARSQRPARTGASPAGSRGRGWGPRWRAAAPGSPGRARLARAPGRARRATSSGTGRPSARPSSPATTSATSAFGPCPAPRNFST